MGQQSVVTTAERAYGAGARGNTIYERSNTATTTWASCQKAVQSKDTRKMGFYRKLERCAKKSCEAYTACAR